MRERCTIPKHIVIAVVLLCCLLQLNVNAQQTFSWQRLPGNAADTGSASGDYRVKATGGHLYIYKPQAGVISDWDGSKWKTISMPSGYVARVEQIEVVGPALIIAGNFFYTASGKQFSMLRYDANEWDTVAASENCNLNSLQVYNNFVYALEDSAQLGNRLVRYNSQWKRQYVSQSVYSSDYRLLLSNHKLLLYAGSSMIIYDGSKFNTVKNISGIALKQVSVISDSQLILYCKFQNVFNRIFLFSRDSVFTDITPGTDILLPGHTPAGFASNSSKVMMGVNPFTDGFIAWYSLREKKWLKTKLSMDQFKMLLLTGDRKEIYLFDTTLNAGRNGIYRYVDKSGISGKVFYDTDHSCNYNSGDFPLRTSSLTLYNDELSYSFNSDLNGQYRFSLPLGTYKLKSNLPYSFIPCADSIVIDSVKDYENVDIPVRVSRLRDDFSVALNASKGFRARQGFLEQYNLSYAKLGNTGDSLVLIVNYPQNLVFESADRMPDSHNGNTLTYRYGNMKTGDNGLVKLFFRVTMDNRIGDTLVFSAVIQNMNDSNTADNRDTLVQQVVSAYDPNFKECYPAGNTTQSLKQIKYYIHFQNLGTDTAYRVTVIDTINNKLPLSSVRVMGTSHMGSYSLKRVQDNALVWEFNDIMLPPKKINDSASQGWICFVMNVRPGVQIGDSITNKAYIYFDYQKPVITNTASVTLMDVRVPDAELKTRFNIYPSPNNGLFKLGCTGPVPQKPVYVYDVLGRCVAVSLLVQDAPTVIDISGSAPGIYIVKDKLSGAYTKFILK